MDGFPRPQVVSKTTTEPAGASALEPCEVRASIPPRFDIGTQKVEMLAYLEEHGYVVVADVADTDAVEKGKAMMWDYFESVPNTQVKRDDVRTWGTKNDWPAHHSNGIVGGFGFGQHAFMWHLRLLPKVKETFAAIWRTSDLLVSFDGGNAFLPWRYDPSWLTDGGWYHVDQNANRPGSRGKVCVQGLVTLTDVDENTGGLVVIPGSHKQHDAICKRVHLAKAFADFFPLPVGDPLLESEAILVGAKAGDLVLWDSRTVHCNTPALTAPPKDDAPAASSAEQPVLASPTADDNGKPWQLIRQVGYVCMTPARFATEDVLEKRRQAFIENFSTSHWPHKFHFAGYALPDQPENDPSAVSAEQRALIGFDRSRSTCAIL